MDNIGSVVEDLIRVKDSVKQDITINELDSINNACNLIYYGFDSDDDVYECIENLKEIRKAKNNKLREAYKTVYDDMMKHGVDLFKGKYDAQNGDIHFMYGMHCAMEFIAYSAGQLWKDNDPFLDNMIKSQTMVTSEELKDE